MAVQPTRPTPSLHTRAWTGQNPPELVERADRVEVLLRQRHDVEGLRQLEALRFRAREVDMPGANALVPATAAGGAIAGGLALGLLGVVGGLALGLAGTAHVIAVGAKALNEHRLAKFLEEKEKGGPPVRTPSPTVREELTPTEVQRAGLSAASVLTAGAEPRARMLQARSLWDHPKPGTTACDTVWDGRTGQFYTGVGNVDSWYLTAFGRDGKVAWAATDEPATSSPALGPEGSVYFRTRTGLEVRDAQGAQRWTYPAGSSWSSSAPAVAADGTAFLLRGSGRLGVHEPNQRLVAVREGQELWHFDLEGDYTGKPQILVAADGTVYVTGRVDERSGVLAFTPEGRLKGRADVSSWPSYVGSGMSLGPDGTLYACHGDQQLTAFTPDLREKWTYRIEDRVVSHGRSRLAQAPVADAEGNVYLSTEISADYPEGYLRKLDPQGREVWSLTVPGGLSTRPHLGPDGTLWVGAGRGDLLNVDRDGVHRESVPVGPTSWNNFAFGPDGEILLNTRTRILAFQPAAPVAAAVPPRPVIEEQGETIVIGGVRLPLRPA